MNTVPVGCATRAACLAIAVAVSVCSLAVAAIAQKTWIVQGNPQSFQNVIAQVRHGDTVLVRPGTYDGATIDKGVMIRCDPGVRFVRHGSHGAAGMAIVAIPRSRTLRLVGGSIDWTTWILDCPGDVILESYGSNLLYVTRCGRVSFNRCRLATSQITDSSASFSECQLSGIACGRRPSVTCGALTVKNSTVTFGGGNAIGREKNFFFAAAPGVYLDSGELLVAGDALIRGGAADAPAIWSNRGTIRLGKNVQLRNTGGPLIRGNATVIRDDYPAIATVGVGGGQVFSMNVHAQPGSLVWAFASPPAQPTSTPLGNMWISLPLGFTLDKGPVPGTGVRQTSFTVPPITRGIPITIQALTMTRAGRFLFGTPTTIVTR